MEYDNQLKRIADRVLKNYRGFQKLASLSDKPFSVHGQTLAEEIDRVVNSLTGLEKAILVNQYQTRPKERQSRQRFCLDHGISIDDYNQVRNQALASFAREYLGGVLLTMD
ncbi:hypothetical protein [Streptococcus suis]|uniref:hypothetical protein n=1 Tax=Streptococcus suis TaxID=1307 RepID=UPI00300FCB54